MLTVCVTLNWIFLQCGNSSSSAAPSTSGWAANSLLQGRRSIMLPIRPVKSAHPAAEEVAPPVRSSS